MSKLDIKEITDTQFFSDGQKEEWFVGRPFYIDFNKAKLLINDYWKNKVNGIPQGSFLLAFYDNPLENDNNEALLLRVLNPTQLPTDNDVISSMIEYYKDNLNTSGSKTELDDFTRYEFSFSGLECRILGSFYRFKDDEGQEKFEFGADVENFYSPHNYRVFKPTGDILELIVNQRDKDIIAGGESEFPLGRVRYSSSRRFHINDSSLNNVKVYINPSEMLGKRTALFGMTRTGKSNTVKKIIEATEEISQKAKYSSFDEPRPEEENFLNPIDEENDVPKFKVGQIIFDVNGEYANPNLQDEGTAIFDQYSEKTVRYSTLDKQGQDFRIMKINFYRDIETGLEYIKSALEGETGDYVTGLRSIELPEPDKNDESEKTRYYRKRAVYLCCLKKAGFDPPVNFTVEFKGNKTLNSIVEEEYGSIKPEQGITLDQAQNWWETIWENRNHNFFSDYKRKNGKPWIDEELASLLVFLTGKKANGSSVSGYTKFKSVIDMHTNTTSHSFQTDILELLRGGNIVIVDLSQGNPEIQNILSEKICTEIFEDSMNRFINAAPNNFIQFYFEEAHNLFPKKEDKDLSQIYSRIAKEGAKLNLGLVYATQEVSSISSNILKNTQNWFIAHLNNEDETKELKKFYDFEDFTDSLVKFSSKSDKGFVRMKTYSNPFVVPVQIDKFSS
jgi:DNA helicase HerA-like ATPase